MSSFARDHVLGLTAILTIGSVGVVFGAVLGFIPTEQLPHHDGLLVAIPHLNALISAVAIGFILGGWRFIKRDMVERHRRSMMSALFLFIAFLALYLYRVTIEGPTTFAGPETIKSYLYLPLLAIHIALAIICLPLLYYVLLLGLTRSVVEIYDTRHRTIGRIAAPLWLISFALGIVVYLLLYVIFPG
ncbi:DUF420 domain-containing protein [Halocatena halophila]|uniref:DUF420 domain-containing protein n=1 Tax=Halocatena halophila TaxID=2814576 RepID=UPI002ED10130